MLVSSKLYVIRDGTHPSQIWLPRVNTRKYLQRSLLLSSSLSSWSCDFCIDEQSSCERKEQGRRYFIKSTPKQLSYNQQTLVGQKMRNTASVALCKHSLHSFSLSFILLANVTKIFKCGTVLQTHLSHKLEYNEPNFLNHFKHVEAAQAKWRYRGTKLWHKKASIDIAGKALDRIRLDEQWIQ